MAFEHNSNQPFAKPNRPANSAAASGFRWVAEWHPHEATWISWPHNLATWPGRFEHVPATFEQMVRTLADVEHVHVLGGPPHTLALAKEAIGDCENVTLHHITTNDCWIRDFGPTFVLGDDGKTLGGIDWRFNAWGNKYHPHDSDAVGAKRICRTVDATYFRSPLTCEGGGLETDGEGTLLTTSSCLMSSARNPGWTRDQIEQELQQALAVEKVLWIDGGSLEGDDTDSHIDQLVRFIRPGLVVAAVSRNSDDSNHEPLAKQLDLLRQGTDARGRKFDIVPIETPPPRYIQGQRVPESYCNFYIANEIVLVPQFGFRETDEAALKQLGELMPDRRMVPIDSRELIWGRGSFHCSTQQQPKTLAL